MPEIFCILILKLFLRALWCNLFKQNLILDKGGFFQSFFFYLLLVKQTNGEVEVSPIRPSSPAAWLECFQRPAPSRPPSAPPPNSSWPGGPSAPALCHHRPTHSNRTQSLNRIFAESQTSPVQCVAVSERALANALSDVAFLQLKSGFAQLFWLGFTWASKAVSQ